MDDKSLTEDPIVLSKGWTWEIRKHGTHRLCNKKMKSIGFWADYQQPARSECNKYIVFSDYWCGNFPTKQLLKISVVK